MFNRLGEVGDRVFENQLHHVSGLNLVIAEITLGNTVYRERAVTLRHKSPNRQVSLEKSFPLIRTPDPRHLGA